MAVYWSLVFGIVVVPFTLLKLIAARKQLPHNLPLSTLTRNAISGAGMALFLLLYRFYYPWTPGGLFATLNYVLLPGFASLVVYAILNFLIDPYFRGIVFRLFNSAQDVVRRSG